MDMLDRTNLCSPGNAANISTACPHAGVAAPSPGQSSPSPPPPPPQSPPPPLPSTYNTPPPQPALAAGQTAVIAALQLTGSGLLPFAEAQQNELQLALFDTINNLIGAQFTILNLTEVQAATCSCDLPLQPWCMLPALLSRPSASGNGHCCLCQQESYYPELDS